MGTAIKANIRHRDRHGGSCIYKLKKYVRAVIVRAVTPPHTYNTGDNLGNKWQQRIMEQKANRIDAQEQKRKMEAS